jgi:flagellar FliJ protein
MADLKPLIRLRKYRVEERQKALAEIFRQLELLEGRKRHLITEVDREQALAENSGSIDSMVAYGAYAARVYLEVEKLNIQITRMEPRLQKAQEDMREAFSEQKKAEIIQEQRNKEEAEAIAKKENADLDAIGIEVFRRKET